MAERYIVGGGDLHGTFATGPVVVYTDDFGTTFSSASSAWDSYSFAYLRDIGVGPSNLLAAAGTSGGFSSADLMLSSSDLGLTWSAVAGPSGLNGSNGDVLWTVRYAPSLSLWVVAGVSNNDFSAQVYSSPDLSTWTARTNNFNTSAGSGVSGVNGTTLDVGNGVVMQTGQNSTPNRWVARTTDLSTWTYPSTMTISAPKRVRYLNGSWFVCGATSGAPKLFQSTDDGVTFSDITPGSGLASATVFYDIAWNGSVYVLIGDVSSSGDPKAWTSSNLSTWTSRSGASLTHPRVAYAKVGTSTPSVMVGADPITALGIVVEFTNDSGPTWSTKTTDLDNRAALGITSVPTVAAAMWDVQIITGRR